MKIFNSVFSKKKIHFILFLAVILFECTLGIKYATAQDLKKLNFVQIKDAPQLIEREKAVLYIRSTVKDIFVNSTNPGYTFRRVEDKEGEWVLRINPSETYMISIGAPGHLSTVPQKFVLKLKEVQVWEVTSIEATSVTNVTNIPDGIGKLIIKGRPEGAKLELDFLQISNTLPATIERIKSGSHTIQVITDNIYSVPNPTQVIVQPNETTEIELNDKLEYGVLTINEDEVKSLTIGENIFYRNERFIATKNKISYLYEKKDKQLFVQIPVKDSVEVQLNDTQGEVYTQKYKLRHEDSVLVFPERLNKATLRFNTFGIDKIRINEFEPVVNGSLYRLGAPYKMQQSGYTLLVTIPVRKPAIVELFETKPIYPIYTDTINVRVNDVINVQADYAKVEFDTKKYDDLEINTYKLVDQKVINSQFPYKIEATGAFVTVYLPTTAPQIVQYSKKYFESETDTLNLKKGEFKKIERSLKPQIAKIEFKSDLDSVKIFATLEFENSNPINFKEIGYSNETLEIGAGNYWFKYEKDDYETLEEKRLIYNKAGVTSLQVPVKLKWTRRIWNGKRIFWALLIGGGGYAAYNYLIKPEMSGSGSSLPLPPGFPDGVGF